MPAPPRTPRVNPIPKTRTSGRLPKPRRRDPRIVADAVLNGMGLVALHRRQKTGTSGSDESEIATDARIRVVERLLAAGMTQAEVVVWAEQEWGLGEASIGIIIDKMRERWRQHDATAIPNLRAQYRRSLQLIHQTSMGELADGPRANRAQHARNALKCIDQLCRLDGVYEPDVVQVNFGATPELEEVAEALEGMVEILQMARTRETTVIDIPELAASGDAVTPP